MYLARMKIHLTLLVALAVLFACVPAIAQEPVVGVTGAEADALFTSKNPKLNTNKQAAYHIMKDLLEANHWDLADKWLTPAYHQHNPNVASGRDGVVKFFSSFRKPTRDSGASYEDQDRRGRRGRRSGDRCHAARIQGSEGSVEEVHNFVVRHVAFQ